MQDYKKLLTSLKKLHPAEARAHCRNLCRTDLYFLLRYGLNRPDVEKEWLFERCKEVEREPDGFIDLWSRDHYKSTIITYAKTIQDILSSHGEDPLPKWDGREITVGIFSCTRPIAKGFMRQIKREFEDNELLREWFPDVLWENPSKDAPKWSEDDGLIVRRRSNPKEATVEAWGLVDGQPTSKHFFLRVYDDVVTVESVSNTDMIKKVTGRWELSLNLGTNGGIERYVGTRYHFNDTYKTIMERGTAVPRIHRATKDGTVDGDPVLLDKDTLAKKRRDMGPYTFACQMLQDPKADEVQGFKEDWLRYYSGRQTGEGQNVYILVDPASEKKKTSDYTAMFVVGLGADNNYYILDIVRDRLSLTQRAEVLFDLHMEYSPIGVGYEKYGMQADIEHIEYMQEEKNYRFPITKLGGQMPKNDRIRRLIPICETGRLYFPKTLFKTDYSGRTVNLVDTFKTDEYLAFPVGVHDDMIDCLSRICDDDMNTYFPRKNSEHVIMSNIDWSPLD